MNDPGSHIPGYHRPVTVDYIDNHLQQQHPMFVNPLVRYDPLSGRYISNSDALIPRPEGHVQAEPGSQITNLENDDLPPRTEWTSISAMKIWNGMFPEAMAEFKKTTEPRARSHGAYSIREAADWDAIYHILQDAQAQYQKEGGAMNWLRKARRTVADNITPVSTAVRVGVKAAPSDPIATPVLAAVEVVLNAVKTAAKVRTLAIQAFDGLIPIFSDVELFLTTFQGDGSIRRVSLDLAITTLDAIERTIGFFGSNAFLKGGKALLTGADYEKGMVESLAMIKTRSTSLMEEAAKSHIHEFHMYSEQTRKFHRQAVQMMQSVGHGLDSLNALLSDHLKQKEYKIQFQEQELQAARQENMRLQVENGFLRGNTPSPQRRSLPPANEPTPTAEPYISQEALRRMLDTLNLDATDMAFVDEKKSQLPERQRVVAEQIVNTPLFRRWIVSAASTKLLIHWDFNLPETIADVSPLTVFCTTMTRALRARDHFLSIAWLCGQHIDATVANPHVGGRAMLASLIDQLLRQWEFDTRVMSHHINIAALAARDVHALVQLMEWLAGRLPEIMTLVIIIDGVYLLEREEFEVESLPILSSLLRLVGNRSISATVKVLFTSTPATDIVRGAFENEDLILDVNGAPQLGWAPSDERLLRELEGS